MGYHFDTDSANFLSFSAAVPTPDLPLSSYPSSVDYDDNNNNNNNNNNGNNNNPNPPSVQTTQESGALASTNIGNDYTTSEIVR